MSNKKTVRLQHGTYLGADHATKYTQHRINIPDEIIKKMEWANENKIVLQIHHQTKNKKKIIQLNDQKYV